MESVQLNHRKWLVHFAQVLVMVLCSLTTVGGMSGTTWTHVEKPQIELIESQKAVADSGISFRRANKAMSKVYYCFVYYSSVAVVQQSLGQVSFKAQPKPLSAFLRRDSVSHLRTIPRSSDEVPLSISL